MTKLTIMTKLLSKAAVVALSAIVASPCLSAQTIWDGSADTEWEGDGSPGNPYLISSAAELAGLAKRTNANETFEGKYFRLTADLWLSDTATPDKDKPLWDPIGMSNINNDDPEQNPGGFWSQDFWFKGNFDGDGHTIHNLWYAHDSEFVDNFDDPFNDGTFDFTGWSKSLFGNIENATITNLKLENANIQSVLQGAALVCVAKNSTITDIAVDGLIMCGTSERQGGAAGGIVAEAERTTFERCSSSASVRSVSGAGGLAAQLTSCTVKDCVSTGRVASMRGAGGLAGFVLSGSEITDSRSSAQVIQLTSNHPGPNIGGFVGSVSGSTIKCCSSRGNLKVEYNGYGFVGSVIDESLVESCYAVCDIVKDGYAVTMASFVGDIGASVLVGEDPVHGYVRNCYGAAKYTYQPCPSDVITTGNHIGGFANGLYVGSQAANCFYNSDTATGINSMQPADEDPQPLWFEFGLTTDYMQSQAFVDQLNEMAGVIGSSLWKYNPGAYPTPTGVIAQASYAPFAGGEGTEASPWRIATKQHLLNLARLTNHGWTFGNQFIEQTADIALNAPKEQWGEEMPELWTPIGEYCKHSNRAFQFHGTYDGKLHTVSNMYQECNVVNYSGLFGVIGDGACIRNLGVTDVYIDNSAAKNSIVSGILVGSAGLFNDESYGLRRIENCWTSGSVESFASSGFIGGLTQWGKTIISNCYTTATLLSNGYRIGGAFIADKYAGTTSVDLQASYFNGTLIKNGYSSVPGIFNMCTVTDSYYSTDAYSYNDYEYFSCGRSSAYMTTPEFVNELSFAASASSLESPWKYTEGQTASFFGTAPSIDVTFEIDDARSISFKAIPDSKLSAPSVTAPEEGMVFRGWYNADTSLPYDFANTPVTAPLTLRAKWAKGITPDYTPFKNKFATTYHIKTPAHLLAFANIVNGDVDYSVDGVEQKDFEGYTVVLDNDIEWNPVDDYDSWGNGVVPVAFRPIGKESNDHFNGTFDGKGHSIIGLYINESLWGGTFGMFTGLGKNAVVENLILKNAYVEAGHTYSDLQIGILAVHSYGRIYRCGVEGKIVMNDAANETGSVGGLICLANSSSTAAPVEECYAIVEAHLKSQSFGGLTYFSNVNIDNSYARSDVRWMKYGNFGGLVLNQGDRSVINNSWCASGLDWTWTMEDNKRPGGAVYGNTHTNNGAYYDMTRLGDIFGPESDWDNLPSWEYVPNPYKLGTGLSESDMKRMDTKPGFDFAEIWGRRNDLNDGYPYLRWTAPGLENDPDETAIPATGLKLDITEYTGKAGTTLQLKATVEPENATDNALTWSSSNPEVASVDNDGLVSLLTVGTATITVHCGDLSASCELTVEAESSGIDNVVIDEDTEVNIITLQGIRVYTGPFAGHHLAPGIYIVRLANGASSKIIIK